MDEPTNLPERPEDELSGWDFEGARRRHLEMGLRMTPAERLQWLEETVDPRRAPRFLRASGGWRERRRRPD